MNSKMKTLRELIRNEIRKALDEDAGDGMPQTPATITAKKGVQNMQLALIKKKKELQKAEEDALKKAQAANK